MSNGGNAGRSAWRGLQFDLRGKITFALLAATLVIGAVVTLSSYFLIRQQLTSHTDALLASSALLERREIELQLSGMVALAESLSNNIITANALADSRGSELYLAPLLRNQKLAGAGADLSIVDYRGRVVSGTVSNIPDIVGHGGLRTVLNQGGPWAGVELASASDNALSRVVLILPIRYRLTDSVEGAVVLRVPIAPLLAPVSGSDSRWIADGDGLPLTAQRPQGPVLQHSTALQLPPPLDALGLRLILARDRAVAFRMLDLLLLVFVAIGVVVMAGVAFFARAGARFITAPLGELAAAAEEIAASGRPVASLPVRRDDEFGRLSAAFNTMVERLRESYGALEDLVAKRTHDFEESQREAERVSKLLREAVQSVAVGFCIFDKDDRLVMCNESYLRFHQLSRDLIRPGARFEDIARGGAERGQYWDAIGRVDAWLAERVASHRAADGRAHEEQLGDGRWLLTIDHVTRSGYVVGNRIDITELKRTTEALRMREAYQRATLDNLPFMFWLKDDQSRFLAVNKLFAETCGRQDPEALVGLCDQDVWPPDLAELYRADDIAVMVNRSEKMTEEAIARDGAIHWIETYKKVVIGEDERPLGTVGFSRDITERKRIEAQLAESEQRWALAVRGANDGVWDANLVTGEMFYSERWKEMLGYRGDEIAGRAEVWQGLLHPDDRTRVLAEYEAHLAGLTDFYQAEYRMRCRDGQYKWLLSRGKASFDAAGRPVRMAGSHTDVSERREAEARVRDRNEQLNTIFALSPDGFVSFDAAQRVKYASPAFLQMCGLVEADVVGLSESAFSTLLAAACEPQARFAGVAAMRAAPAGEGGRGARHLIELAGAGKRVLEVGMRVADAETVSQILYFRDVTHETEVDRMKSEFLSIAAHELRTPMASIFGFSELMLNQEFAEAERREFLEAIHRQSTLMVGIINELLDLSRIEARRGKDFSFARVELRALLQEFVASFKAPDDRAAPILPAPGPSCWVRADRRKIFQAVGNVISNAYKYSPGGGPVEIDLLRGDARVGLQVRDHGIGMTPRQSARVCERFYRADASGSIPGTGLGMSIVSEIIELHDGEVAIESTPGAGTCVTLWLPLAPGDEGGHADSVPRTA